MAGEYYSKVLRIDALNACFCRNWKRFKLPICLFDPFVALRHAW